MDLGADTETGKRIEAERKTVQLGYMIVQITKKTQELILRNQIKQHLDLKKN